MRTTFLISLLLLLLSCGATNPDAMVVRGRFPYSSSDMTPISEYYLRAPDAVSKLSCFVFSVDDRLGMKIRSHDEKFELLPYENQPFEPNEVTTFALTDTDQMDALEQILSAISKDTDLNRLSLVDLAIEVFPETAYSFCDIDEATVINTDKISERFSKTNISKKLIAMFSKRGLVVKSICVDFTHSISLRDFFNDYAALVGDRHVEHSDVNGSHSSQLPMFKVYIEF